MIRFLPEEPIRRHAELCNVGDRLQLEVREAVDDALARAGARLTDQKKERKKKRKTGKKASGASSPRMAAQSSHSGTLGLPAWPQLLFEKFTIMILESCSIECFFSSFLSHQLFETRNFSLQRSNCIGNCLLHPFLSCCLAGYRNDSFGALGPTAFSQLIPR